MEGDDLIWKAVNSLLNVAVISWGIHFQANKDQGKCLFSEKNLKLYRKLDFFNHTVWTPQVQEYYIHPSPINGGDYEAAYL